MYTTEEKLAAMKKEILTCTPDTLNAYLEGEGLPYTVHPKAGREQAVRMILIEYLIAEEEVDSFCKEYDLLPKRDTLKFQDVDYTDAVIAAAVSAAHKQTDEPKDRIIAAMSRSLPFEALVLVLGKTKHVCWRYNNNTGELSSGVYDREALATFYRRVQGVRHDC